MTSFDGDSAKFVTSIVHRAELVQMYPILLCQEPEGTG
jgi:hypothetical protein